MPWRRDVSTRIGIVTPSVIRPRSFSPMLFIDAMNVIGSRPDGWWRDREGAIRRLIDEVRAWADVVVTSDTALGDRVRARGASVEGAGSFRRRLASPG